MSTENIEVAKTILSQLGGNRFIMMTGSKNLLSCDNGTALRMQLISNKAKAKFLKIKLEANDTYTMTFSKVKRTKDTDLAALGVTYYHEEYVEVKTLENVYDDMLQEVFTEVTGLYTHF
jgi:hypothetical protein